MARFAESNQKAFPVKAIPHEQSRKNSARRGRKAKARQARARRGRARSKPVFGPGKIHLEIGDRIGAMSFGGIGVIRRLVSGLGLVREIDRRLYLLKRHLPYRESDHVLNIAYNVLCGGTRLEDPGGLRTNVPYLDALDAEMIPSPPAGGAMPVGSGWRRRPSAGSRRRWGSDGSVSGASRRSGPNGPSCASR